MAHGTIGARVSHIRRVQVRVERCTKVQLRAAQLRKLHNVARFALTVAAASLSQAVSAQETPASQEAQPQIQTTPEVPPETQVTPEVQPQTQATPQAPAVAVEPAESLPEVVVQDDSSAPKPQKKLKTKPAAAPVAASPVAAPVDMTPDDVLPVSDGASTPAGAVGGYVAKTTTVGTKTATPLAEVPQSITTVTRKQLEDRKPFNLESALGYVPGVRVNGAGFDPRFDCVNIRGFDCLTGDSLFRDGLRQMGSPFGIFRNELYGLDSLTVLRGPSSMLYGASSAGGIIDMYTKRPTEVPFHEVEFLIGNHDRFQGNFDFSGPITPGSSTLYRMTGVVRDSDTQQLGVEDDRLYLAPALTFRPDADTKITVFGEYMDSNAGGNMAYWNDYSGERVRRTDIVSGDPAFNDFPQEQWRIGYEIDHRVNSVLTLRQKARYVGLDSRLEYIDLTDLPEDTSVIPRANGTLEDKMHTAVIDNLAEFKFLTGALGHTLLAGVDSSYLTYNEAEGFGESVPLINFNYGQQFIPDPPIIGRTSQDLFSVGTYLQDQIRLDRWLLTLGGRHDWVRTDTDWWFAGDEETPASTASQDKKDKAWSGRVALGYLLESGLSPYVAYATSFNPIAGTNPPEVDDAAAFDPTSAKSKEVGFKYIPPGTNISLASAIFEIEQENGLVAETFERDGVQLSRLVQAGILRSRGFEIESAASLDNGFSFLVSYSYIDMTIVEGDEGLSGNTLSSIPHHTASLWADYTFKYGPAQGFGFGGGIRYIGTSYGNDENTFKNEARTLVDAAAHYDLEGFDPQFKGARLQFNVSNIFDTEKDVCQADYCYRDQGRMILGSLRYRW